MTKKLSADLERDMGQGARDKEEWESEVSAEAEYDSDWRTDFSSPRFFTPPQFCRLSLRA